MYWRKRDLLKAAAVVGGVLFLVLMALVTVTVADARSGVSGAYSAGMVTVQATPTEDATVTALNKEKLQLDVDQEKHTLANWLWSGGAHGIRNE